MNLKGVLANGLNTYCLASLRHFEQKEKERKRNMKHRRKRVKKSSKMIWKGKKNQSRQQLRYLIS